MAVRAFREGWFWRGASHYLKDIALETLIIVFHFLFERKVDICGRTVSYRLRYDTALSERIIEIPYSLELLFHSNGEDVLEVGNVLKGRLKQRRDILDKYETEPGIINEDVATFVSDKKYDFIISVSTLEHVGFDEEAKEQGKFLKSVVNLKSMLRENGIMLMTLPLGYNPEVDEALLTGSLQYTECCFLKRTSMLNSWRSFDIHSDGIVSYGKRYPAANCLAILRFDNHPNH